MFDLPALRVKVKADTTEAEKGLKIKNNKN